MPLAVAADERVSLPATPSSHAAPRVHAPRHAARGACAHTAADMISAFVECMPAPLPAPAPQRAAGQPPWQHAVPPLPAAAAPAPTPAATLAAHPISPACTAPAAAQPALARRKPWAPRLCARQPLRGTLSQQLASITAAAEGVTASLQGRAPQQAQQVLGACLSTLPALQLRVGRVLARRGAPVCCYSDHASFVFALGAASEVDMTMFFADIRDSTRASGPSVSFRVRAGSNMRAFGEQHVAAHSVTLTFPSAATASAFVAAVKA